MFNQHIYNLGLILKKKRDSVLYIIQNVVIILSSLVFMDKDPVRDWMIGIRSLETRIMDFLNWC